MKDKRMKVLGLLTALSLAVCLISSNVVSNTGFSYAQTSGLEWTRITIPGEDDMQLYPGYDIGPMAVSPDGATVFAAVQNELILTDWDLLKSIDGAFTWQDTGLSNAMAAIADTGDIVAIELSPSWNTDGTIFVSTENRVYYSEDRGRTFDDLNPVPGTIYAAGTDVITSLDLALDSSGRIVVAVGTANPAITTTDVYILDIGGWVAQGVGAYDVLAVGLSPNYATDEAIIAVVTDATKTVVRTKLGIGAWGVAILDATSNLNFPSSRACIGFPNDYDASGSGGVLTLFVGLSAAGPLGDVFRINGGWLIPSTVADLDVRGYANPPTNTIPTEANIWSMAVSGSASSMDILAGTEALNPSALPAPPGQFLVYTSSNTGGNWSPNYDEYLSYKQPTGETKATVVMSPSISYVGTFGGQSAVSAALSAESPGGVPFHSWNQHGLIDTVISEITDMSPSEAYSADGTMFITTRDATPPGDTSLWRTETEGGTWERVYCSTLVVSPATCMFDLVRLSSGAVVVAQSGSKAIVPSFDDCATFQATRSAQQNITAFAVSDENTYYTGDANGGVWQTINAGATWTSSTGSEIPIADMVADLVLTDAGDIYAGTNQGGVYKDSGGDLSFIQVGPDTPGASGDIVHVASNPCDDNFVYAGIQGGAATQGIWRFDLSDDEAEWEQIADGTEVGDISSIVCSDCIGMDGVLYAVSTGGTGWRSINPTSITELPVFEEIDKGLGAGDSVRRGLKLVYGSNYLFAVGGATYTQIWTASDEIVKMKLLAPKDGSIAGTIMEDEAFLGRAIVMLEWKEIPGAESYEVQIGFDEELDSPVDISYYDGGTPYSNGMVKVAYPWLGTKYYWRVRVGKAGPSGVTIGAPYSSQWSETWSFTTPLGPAPSIPELLSPQPGQEDVILRPVLQWNSSVAATSYELILAANCDWNNPVLNLSGESAISDTAYQITFDLAKNTSYCWQVRGVNDITHSPWSDTGTFTTGFTAEAENAGLPVWVWVIIALASILILSILVLIVRSRRY